MLYQGLFLRYKFQHTAARRRLDCGAGSNKTFGSFNTQPPEGGCFLAAHKACNETFQHTAARRRLLSEQDIKFPELEFQHTAARRRLGLTQMVLLGSLGFNTQPPEGGWLDMPSVLI